MVKKLDRISNGMFLTDEFQIEETQYLEEIMASTNTPEETKVSLDKENKSELVLVSRNKKLTHTSKISYSLAF